MFDGKTILVTGGAGSFGRSFVQELFSRYKPRKVIVYSRDELKHFNMQMEFKQPELRFFIGDVRDRDRLDQALSGVDLVVHASALKQVPAAEYNPMECIRTNIYGAENVLQAAIRNNVERVVALSTDKAAAPINLYGATKLASDKLFVAGNNMTGGRRTRFSVVRYGNVVGSNGSVVPFFQKLIDGGATELPVTDKRMTRFWITLPQGVQFVIDSFMRMQGGEIFVPRIPSMRILDLVESMAPGMATQEVGIRPGEKLHELMCPADDSHLTLEFDDHFVIRPTLKFYDMDVDYTTNRKGETGKPVEAGWEYSSGTNPDFLTVEQLRALNAEVPK